METTIAVKERLIEEKLIGFWKEILEQETIGTDSNFFDLGGIPFSYAIYSNGEE